MARPSTQSRQSNRSISFSGMYFDRGQQKSFASPFSLRVGRSGRILLSGRRDARRIRHFVRVALGFGRVFVSTGRRLPRRFANLRRGETAHRILVPARGPAVAATRAVLRGRRSGRLGRMLGHHESLRLLQQISVVAQRRYQRQV